MRESSHSRPAVDGLSTWILKSSGIMTGSDADNDRKPGIKRFSESAGAQGQVINGCREEGCWAVLWDGLCLTGAWARKVAWKQD